MPLHASYAWVVRTLVQREQIDVLCALLDSFALKVQFYQYHVSQEHILKMVPNRVQHVPKEATPLCRLVHCAQGALLVSDA